MYWGAVFLATGRVVLVERLLRLEEEYRRSVYFIYFFGVNFEARNETRDQIWNGMRAEPT